MVMLSLKPEANTVSDAPSRAVTEVTLRRKGVIFFYARSAHPRYGDTIYTLWIRNAGSLKAEIEAAITERVPLVGKAGESLPVRYCERGRCSTCGDSFQLPQESGRGGTCCLCIRARMRVDEVLNVTSGGA